MSLIIPVQPVPTQTLAVVLAGQPAQIEIRQNGANMYFSLRLADRPIVLTRICRNRQRLLLDVEYKGFIGDFEFQDTQGAEQPTYIGLGTRFVLRYFGADE